ncbi:acyltransferase [Pseudoalteromonas rubra]|uniref:Acyltransferase n=1 Tax=Pseudoalteromonas rubra TaxID=43658 RepID=A0A5S3WV44_9GAMM|nr:acyltransferase family protein [Pseudoalteromonas rubra]TMP28056.1 acyltransferase [Pseudoalteromonas rubra]TMP32720.1 acyltransferase [Pseudoalteromonas rubra]
MQSSPRFHYIDNLRSLALLLGVVFHAALAYGPYFSNIWFTADPTNHVAFDYFAIWSHLFRMPLFFVIAGFCAALLISKRGGNGFIINRLKRVLLPFVVFFPLTMLVLYHALGWGAEIAHEKPALFTVFQSVKEPIISTMHLWFLWNLTQFCLLCWLLQKHASLYQSILAVVVRPAFLLVALPILLTVALYQQLVPFPAPDKLYPELWSYDFYGVLFLVGAGLYHHHIRVQQYARYFIPLLIMACLSLVPYFYLMPSSPSLEAIIRAANTGVTTPEHIDIFVVIAQSIAIVAWTGVAFLAGYKWLNQFSQLNKYLSDASYWIYLIHVPILIYIQFPLSNTTLSPWLKMFVAVSATMALGLLSYQLLVRHTLIGVLLNGKRVKTARSQQQATPIS